MFGFLDPPEMIIVLVVVLVLFGGSQLPKLAKNLGKAQKEFKDGMGEGATKPPTEPPPQHRRRADHRSGHSRRPPPTPVASIATGVASRPVGARSASVISERSGVVDRAALEDAAPLTLAAATPHAVLDALFEGVLEARVGDRAVRCRSCGPDRRRRRRSGRTPPADSCGSCPRPSTPWRSRGRATAVLSSIGRRLVVRVVDAGRRRRLELRCARSRKPFCDQCEGSGRRVAAVGVV